MVMKVREWTSQYYRIYYPRTAGDPGLPTKYVHEACESVSLRLIRVPRDDCSSKATYLAWLHVQLS